MWSGQTVPARAGKRLKEGLGGGGEELWAREAKVLRFPVAAGTSEAGRAESCRDNRSGKCRSPELLEGACTPGVLK